MEITPLASGSAGNCYVVNDEHGHLLILDAGIPAPAILRGINFRPDKVSAVLITHEHGDHIKAAPHLIRQGFPVWATEGTIGTMDARSAWGATSVKLDEWQPTEDDAWQIYPFPAEHDAAQPCGYIARATATGEAVLYLTDSYYTRYSYPAVTHMVIECNYLPEIVEARIASGDLPAAQAARLYRSHMSLDTVLQLLHDTHCPDLRQIFLAHMSDGNGDAHQAKIKVQQLTGAEVYVCGAKGGIEK